MVSRLVPKPQNRSSRLWAAGGPGGRRVRPRRGFERQEQGLHLGRAAGKAGSATQSRSECPAPQPALLRRLPCAAHERVAAARCRPSGMGTSPTLQRTVPASKWATRRAAALFRSAAKRGRHTPAAMPECGRTLAPELVPAACSAHHLHRADDSIFQPGMPPFCH